MGGNLVEEAPKNGIKRISMTSQRHFPYLPKINSFRKSFKKTIIFFRKLPAALVLPVGSKCEGGDRKIAKIHPKNAIQKYNSFNRFRNLYESTLNSKT